MKARDKILAQEIGGEQYQAGDRPDSLLDAPLYDIPGETSRSMQRKGFRGRVAALARQRRVQEHSWGRHQQAVALCPTCAFHINWFAASIYRKRKTVEELFR